MNENEVTEIADELDSYANHFEHRDWDYTRDLNGLAALRRDEDRFPRRVRNAFHWLVDKPQNWQRTLGVNRFRMTLFALRRPANLPDGILDDGSVITLWEETGEYLQYVQPSVGALIAEWLKAEPANPHAVKVAAEMKRIQDRYADRIAGKQVGAPDDVDEE